MASPRPARRGSDRGFTLIELLVVMMVIGILASIAIPTFVLIRNKAYDTAAKSIARNALTAEVAFTLDNPEEGYLDLWQDGEGRTAAMAQIEGSSRWYDGWFSNRSPAPGQVMVIAGHTNSGSLVDDWVLLTVLSRSGDCLSTSREDVPPQDSSSFVVGTYYWRGASSGGSCPQAPNGNRPPSVTPSGPATAAAWGTSW